MANSRAPSCIEPVSTSITPARSGGPLGVRDAGDPNAFEVVVERPSSANSRGYLAASAVATFDPEGTPCLLSVGDGNGTLTEVGRDLLKTRGCPAP